MREAAQLPDAVTQRNLSDCLAGRRAEDRGARRWVAFHVKIEGQKEVQVRRFPDGNRDFQVSIDGGEHPLWSHDGREL